MKGSPLENSNQKAFKPNGYLTRAEASALIYNVLKTASEEEKVVYNIDEENEQAYVNEGESIYEYPAVQVQGNIKDGKIYLSWNKAADKNFSYYKVVVSKSNPSPVYPQDGYLYVISNREQTSAVIENDGYSGGDFGGRLVPGEKYYFSITAVYGDVKVPGNALSLVYPGETTANTANPTLKSKTENGKIVLSWDKASEKGFVYYKVVISKNNSKPKYPDDGYLCYITDPNTTSKAVDNKEAYVSGDFGKYLVPGEKYYFSITYVYDNRKVSTNTLQLTYPKSGTAVEKPKRTAPSVSGSVKGNGIALSWSKASPTGFKYYKVVISKDDSTPVYPEDGYLYVISDVNTTSAVVNNSSAYNGGSFGEYLISGQKYYFSVTAVYDDQKLAGNAVRLTYP